MYLVQDIFPLYVPDIPDRLRVAHDEEREIAAGIMRCSMPPATSPSAMRWPWLLIFSSSPKR
jgi:hypothetical protein